MVHLLVMVSALLLALDFLLDRHSSHPWDKIPGFYAFYGFIGCVLLVIIAKWLRFFLMRPQGYYQQPKPASEESKETTNKSGVNDVAP